MKKTHQVIIVSKITNMRSYNACNMDFNRHTPSTIFMYIPKTICCGYLIFQWSEIIQNIAVLTLTLYRYRICYMLLSSTTIALYAYQGGWIMFRCFSCLISRSRYQFDVSPGQDGIYHMISKSIHIQLYYLNYI